MNSSTEAIDWDERTSANDRALADSQSMFRKLFDHSADVMFLSDPQGAN